MAIFSFRPPPTGSARARGAAAIATDWAETRPSTFDDELLVDAAFGHGAFATDVQSPAGFAPSSGAGADTLPIRLGMPVAPGAPDTSTVAASRPDPGFAKNLTARAQSDDLLGAGWYLSSWDLMQGCEVIEGTPIDLLPPEWQRKRPRL